MCTSVCDTERRKEMAQCVRERERESELKRSDCGVRFVSEYVCAANVLEYVWTLCYKTRFTLTYECKNYVNYSKYWQV